MVALGYGHILIKLKKYAVEKEWRIIVPKRNDHRYEKYFNIGVDKRDFSSSVDAISLGFNIASLPDYEKYRDAVLSQGEKLNIDIFEIINESGDLKRRKIFQKKL